MAGVEAASTAVDMDATTISARDIVIDLATWVIYLDVAFESY